MTNPPPGARLADLRATLAANPGLVLETLARHHGVSLRQVTDCLPDGLRRMADGSQFVPVMRELPSWGPVLVLVHTADVVLEFQAAVPPGSFGSGYYNLDHGPDGLSGHLRPERCAAIAFVERPFMGSASAAIIFFNPEGDAMFKVFVRRGPGGVLDPGQLARFRALRDRIALSDDPRQHLER